MYSSILAAACASAQLHLRFPMACASVLCQWQPRQHWRTLQQGPYRCPPLEMHDSCSCVLWWFCTLNQVSMYVWLYVPAGTRLGKLLAGCHARHSLEGVLLAFTVCPRVTVLYLTNSGISSSMDHHHSYRASVPGHVFAAMTVWDCKYWSLSLYETPSLLDHLPIHLEQDAQ